MAPLKEFIGNNFGEYFFLLLLLSILCFVFLTNFFVVVIVFWAERCANLSLIVNFLSSCFRCGILDNFAAAAFSLTVSLVSILSVEFSYESPVVVVIVF